MVDRKFLNRLYRYAYSLTGNEAAAYDLLQDGLERFLRRAQQDLDDAEAYARRVIRNCYVDDLRRRERRPEEVCPETHEHLYAMDMRNLEQVLITQQEVAQVWRLLDPFEREILYYWAIEGLTAQEVADTLGSRRGTVLSRIHRLRERLSRLVAEDSSKVDSA